MADRGGRAAGHAVSGVDLACAAAAFSYDDAPVVICKEKPFPLDGSATQR